MVDLLTYHVVSGNVSSSQLTNGELVKTVEGKQISVNIEHNDIFLNVGDNGARVLVPNNEASNGVVHLIDRVLIPPHAPSTLNIVQLAQSVPFLSTLVKAVVGTLSMLCASSSVLGSFAMQAVAGCVDSDSRR